MVQRGWKLRAHDEPATAAAALEHAADAGVDDAARTTRESRFLNTCELEFKS